MKPKLNLLNLMPWICVLVFALLSWYFLMMRNADVLYMQQMRSLFNDTSVFFLQYPSLHVRGNQAHADAILFIRIIDQQHIAQDDFTESFHWVSLPFLLIHPD